MRVAFPSSPPGGERRRRAVLAGVAVGLVVLVAFTVFVIALAEHAVRREAERRVRDTAELSARVVAERIGGTEDLLQATALELSSLGTPSQALLRPEDRASTATALGRLRVAIPGATGVLLLDRLGRVITGVGAAPTRATDLSGQEWVRRLAAEPARTGPYLSRVYPGQDTGGARGGRAVAEASWVRGDDGQALGILAVTLDLRGARALVTLPDDASAVLTITDQGGTLVTGDGPEAARTGLVSLAADGPVADARRGRSGVEVRDRGGRPTVSGFAPVAGTGWVVVADVRASDAFRDVTRLRILLLVGASLAAFFLVWLVPTLVLRLGRAREQVALGERFQADLLPTVMPPGVLAHYLASERRMLLGGDFLDAVSTPDGGLALLVGDVCGHGPRAAALAARLRAGWRTLATAGEPVGRLDLLDRLVASERPDEDLYATVAVAWVSPAGDCLSYALAGHPPLLLDQGGTTLELEEGRGAALGLGVGGPWDVQEHVLWPGWTLVLYTDGLVESFTGEHATRLEVLGVRRLLATARRDGVVDPARFLQIVRELDTAGDHEDDVALLVAGGERGRRGTPVDPAGATRA